MLKYALSKDLGFRQSAIYGLGTIAQFGGTTFEPLKAPTIQVRVL